MLDSLISDRRYWDKPRPEAPKYPCAICDKACRWGQKALACDECDHWYHAACTGIDSTEYSHLANTSISWYCIVCNAPNHSTVLYDLIDSADSNTYSVLSVDKDSTGDLSRVSVSSLSSTIGDPLASSSPKRKDEQPKAKHQAKRTQKNLRVLVVNFQSVKNKRNDLQVMIESSHPDIILGTETWLSDKVNTSEIFPPELGYDVIRRDRKGDTHGGVLIAAKNTLSLNHLLTSKDSELISGTINISQRKKAILTCLYRPPSRQDQHTTDCAIQDISQLRRKHKNDTFILRGDFNLPDIDWDNYTIKGTQTSRDINDSFLRMSADLNLQQVVNIPTRGDNILDLLFTSMLWFSYLNH